MNPQTTAAIRSRSSTPARIEDNSRSVSERRRWRSTSLTASARAIAVAAIVAKAETSSISSSSSAGSSGSPSPMNPHTSGPTTIGALTERPMPEATCRPDDSGRLTAASPARSRPIAPPAVTGRTRPSKRGACSALRPLVPSTRNPDPSTRRRATMELRAPVANRIADTRMPGIASGSVTGARSAATRSMACDARWRRAASAAARRTSSRLAISDRLSPAWAARPTAALRNASSNECGSRYSALQVPTTPIGPAIARLNPSTPPKAAIRRRSCSRPGSSDHIASPSRTRRVMVEPALSRSSIAFRSAPE